MITREQIVTEARAWIGTRWQHQARVKGRATDCAGLVIGVAWEVGLIGRDVDFNGYARQPDGDRMRQVCRDMMVEIPATCIRPGDVVAMRFELEPQHVAIVTDRGIIHAYAQARRVVEHRLDSLWKSRIVGAYQFKGIA